MSEADFERFVRAQPCVARAGCIGAVEFCHDKHRGMGSKKVPSKGNGFPGCRGHHQEYHDRGRKGFEAKYGVDIREVCKQLARDFDGETDFTEETYADRSKRAGAARR